MIFAILFVIAFVIGLVTYLITDKWLSAALISMGLFILNTLSDTGQIDKALYTILLGLPVVFCASLFGAYVVELRRGVDADEVESSSELESQANDNQVNQEDDK